jgi:hypothetical protein
LILIMLRVSYAVGYWPPDVTRFTIASILCLSMVSTANFLPIIVYLLCSDDDLT